MKEKVKDAKDHWAREKSKLIDKMNAAPKFAWRAAQEVMAGIGGHMTNPKTMRFRRTNGELATNPQENMEVLEPHLRKVFNTQRPRFASS